MVQELTIENAIEEILRCVGEDPQRPGLRLTPHRVAEMYRELFDGVNQDPAQELLTSVDEDHHDLVVLRDIPFYSICEHHLLPFFGSTSVAYLPTGKVLGLSKIVRALGILSHRPQLQERLTSQLANTLFTSVQAEGVAVVIKAEHLCMSMRGVQKPGTQVVTSSMCGTFQRESLTKRDLLSLLVGNPG